jgi:hypothetical protein
VRLQTGHPQQQQRRSIPAAFAPSTGLLAKEIAGVRKKRRSIATVSIVLCISPFLTVEHAVNPIFIIL